MPKNDSAAAGRVLQERDRDVRERARDASAALLHSTERLNESLKRAEAALIGLGLGVRASVDMTTVDEGDAGWEETLTFGKNGNTWMLMVESGHIQSDERSVQPLLNAPRDMRLRAADHLEKLMVELVETAERQAHEVHEKVSTVDRFASAILDRSR